MANKEATQKVEEPVREQLKALLTHKHRMGGALREMSLEDVTTTLKIVQEIYCQKEMAQIEELQRLKEKRQKIQAIRRQIEAEGLSMDEVANAPTDVYEYKEADGTKKVWYGKGRMPDRMKALVESGADIEKMRIV